MNTPNNDKTDTKSGSWFLTINNPTSDDEDVTTRLTGVGLIQKVSYAKWAVENGEENNVRHMHIYIHHPSGSQQRFSAILKAFPRAHIQEPIGTPGQQIDYIGNPGYTYSKKHPDKDKRGKPKGGTCEYVREYGTVDGIRLNQSINGGGTLDHKLLALKKLIDEGCEKARLYDADFPTMVRYGGRLEEYYTIVSMKYNSQAPGVSVEHDEDRQERLISEAINEFATLQEESPF